MIIFVNHARQNGYLLEFWGIMMNSSLPQLLANYVKNYELMNSDMILRSWFMQPEHLENDGLENGFGDVNQRKPLTFERKHMIFMWKSFRLTGGWRKKSTFALHYGLELAVVLDRPLPVSMQIGLIWFIFRSSVWFWVFKYAQLSFLLF